MTHRACARIFNRLAGISAVAILAMTSHVKADSAWGPMEIVDMTTSAASVETADSETAPEAEAVQTAETYAPIMPLSHGWRGSIDVDVDDGEALSIGYVPGGTETLKTHETRTVMTGFYTLRYDFKSDTNFRPYAGAGIGIVATGEQEAIEGGVAARAVAGFDIEVDENSGIYAEYAFVKSNGAMFASAGSTGSALSDDEHSLKVGFRRTF